MQHSEIGWPHPRFTSARRCHESGCYSPDDDTAAEKRERVIEAAARSLREDASIASFSRRSKLKYPTRRREQCRPIEVKRTS
jgi:hypothetical protein